MRRLPLAARSFRSLPLARDGRARRQAEGGGRQAVALLLAALLLAASTGMAGTTRLSVAPRSSLLLNGSSNVAPWRCSGTTLNGSMEVAEPIDRINGVLDHIEDGQIGAWMNDPAGGSFMQPTFDLTIPIDTLRCSGGRPMERDMRGALKAKRYPAIRFRFTQMAGGIEHDIDRNTYGAVIEGQLSLAGRTREVRLRVEAERVSRSLFRMHAELPLKMTDFGIAPPKAFFGMLRASDQLSVEFDVFLQP